ncbi:MAG TPA: hypothetical protein VFI47_17975 [Acidimicrobiales bacterium]|nr:hypothetical protein [Acidimicrobiales bacterium]
MRHRRDIGLVVLLVALGGAACGDDGDGAGDSGERQEYVDAIVATSEGGELTEEEQTCVAESFVDAVGVDTFQDADVTPADIEDAPESSPADLGIDVTDEQAADFYGRLSDCIDTRELLLEALTADADLAPDVMTCIEDALDDDLVEDVVTAVYTEGDSAFEEGSPIATALQEALAPCEELAGR